MTLSLDEILLEQLILDGLFDFIEVLGVGKFYLVVKPFVIVTTERHMVGIIHIVENLWDIIRRHRV